MMKSLLACARRWAGTTAWWALGQLPDRLSDLCRPKRLRVANLDIPPPVVAPAASVRLLVAPANFAGQGYAWARSSEILPAVKAVSMQPVQGGAYGFPVDHPVPQPVHERSGEWGRREALAVASNFTHVLNEAERSMFGARFGGSVEREMRWLQARGVQTAFVSHGSDLRLPSRHADSDDWSPFRDVNAGWVHELEERAKRNRRILEKLQRPVFLATPELLLDWPSGVWLPNVVDPSLWRSQKLALSRDVPIVLHAPTRPILKGTAFIEPVVDRMAGEGLIEYRRVENVRASAMPTIYQGADVVIDQLAIGIYSTTSIEAMAAGRLVVAHLHQQVVNHVYSITGLLPPVVRATPETLEATLRDIVARPKYYANIAVQGPEYVRRVHDGEFSANVLRPFLESFG